MRKLLVFFFSVSAFFGFYNDLSGSRSKLKKPQVNSGFFTDDESDINNKNNSKVEKSFVKKNKNGKFINNVYKRLEEKNNNQINTAHNDAINADQEDNSSSEQSSNESEKKNLENNYEKKTFFIKQNLHVFALFMLLSCYCFYASWNTKEIMSR